MFHSQKPIRYLSSNNSTSDRKDKYLQRPIKSNWSPGKSFSTNFHNRSSRVTKSKKQAPTMKPVDKRTGQKVLCTIGNTLGKQVPNKQRRRRLAWNVWKVFHSPNQILAAVHHRLPFSESTLISLRSRNFIPRLFDRRRPTHSYRTCSKRSNSTRHDQPAAAAVCSLAAWRWRCR